mmetsp:Transcript_102080/g.289092  ORF Transcript_102080/g.289092 Transcript_102080/m.289092 type:complete len:141 (+) Transcript_102080:124-546(+)
MFRQLIGAGSRRAFATKSLATLPGPLRASPATLWQAAGQVRGFGDKSGVVKFFNPEKGFGFIQCQDTDYFVHYTGIESSGGFRSLGDGEEVEFDLEVDGQGKQRAVRVTGPGGAAVLGSQRQREGEGGSGGDRGAGGDRY